MSYIKQMVAEIKKLEWHNLQGSDEAVMHYQRILVEALSSDPLEAVSLREQLERLSVDNPIIYAGLIYQRATQCNYEDALIKIILGLDTMNEVLQEREIK